MQPAVFLDRDGVLNHAVVRNGRPYPPASVSELTIVPEAAAVLTALHQDGYRLIAVTNQPDVARGTTARATVEAIHRVLLAELPLDDIVACYHDDADGCGCRKPRPGMLLDAAARHEVDLASSVMVGDRWRDIDAGAAAGCRTVFIDHGYREKLRTMPDATVPSLAAALDAIRQVASPLPAR